MGAVSQVNATGGLALRTSWGAAVRATAWDWPGDIQAFTAVEGELDG